MLYIYLSYEFVEKIMNFNITRLNISRVLNPNFSVLNLSYVNLVLII